MTVDFAGPIATADGGLRRLKQTETKLNLLPRLSRCFRDARDPTRAQHSVAELLAQRLWTSPWARPFLTIPTACGRTPTADFYCARGDTANRISLLADRVHAEP